MKKLVSILCTLAMLLSILAVMAIGAEAATTAPADASKWDGTVPAANKDYAFEGKGTEAEPWLIKNATEFALFAANVRLNDKDTTYGGKFFKLTVDIDIDNKEWWAIGGCRAGSEGLSTNAEDDNRYSYFAGTFDGDNHKIYNLALADSTQITNAESGQPETVALHQQGLFGVIMGATIKNLGIESGNIVVENSNRTAAFVGVGRCGFLVENCYNKADVTVTSNVKQIIVGAFFGQVIDPWNNANNMEQATEGIYNKKKTVNCYNTGDLTVNATQTATDNQFRVGSIAGQYVGGAPEMINVYSVCDITVNYNSVASSSGNRRIGGITGAFLDAGYLEHVYYKGVIKVTATVEEEISKMTLGSLIGQISSSTIADPNETDGEVSVGSCAMTGSSDAFTAKVVGGHSEPAAWYKTVTDVTIPLAENSDFIVDIHYVAPPTETDPPVVTTAKPDVTTAKPDVTTAKPDATEAPATTTPAATEEEGCASGMGVISVLLLTGIASGAAVCVSRRKKEK